MLTIETLENVDTGINKVQVSLLYITSHLYILAYFLLVLLTPNMLTPKIISPLQFILARLNYLFLVYKNLYLAIYTLNLIFLNNCSDTSLLSIIENSKKLGKNKLFKSHLEFKH